MRILEISCESQSGYALGPLANQEEYDEVILKVHNSDVVVAGIDIPVCIYCDYASTLTISKSSAVIMGIPSILNLSGAYVTILDPISAEIKKINLGEDSTIEIRGGGEPLQIASVSPNKSYGNKCLTIKGGAVSFYRVDCFRGDSLTDTVPISLEFHDTAVVAGVFTRVDSVKLFGCTNVDPGQVTGIHESLPSEGAFIAFKRVLVTDYKTRTVLGSRVIKLEIPKEAKRNSRCAGRGRASSAKVLEMYGEPLKEGQCLRSWFDANFMYKIGGTVYADTYNEYESGIFTPGIHFYMSLQGAEEIIF